MIAAIWHLRSVILASALVVFVVLWLGERNRLREAEAEIAAMIEGQRIADEVRKQNAERADRMAEALNNAWKGNEDGRDTPLDAGMLRALECLRNPTTCNNPR